MADQFGGWKSNFLLDSDPAIETPAAELGGWGSNFLLDGYRGESVPHVATPSLPSGAKADYYTDLYQGIAARADSPLDQPQDAYNRNLKLAADMDQANRGPIRGSAPYRVAEDIISASASAVVNPLLWTEGKLGIDAAEEMRQRRMVESDISHQRDMGWGQRIAGGVGESIGEFVTLSAVGGGAASGLGLAGKAYNAVKWAVIGTGIGQNSYAETNRNALKEGKTQEEADKIATATAALEVGVMGLFQKVGLGGAERAMASGLGTTSVRAAERFSLQGIKNFLKQTAGELAEEEITTLTQTLASVGDAGGWEAYRDTAVATIATMGLLSGAQNLVNFVSKPTRKTANKAGLSEIGKTQKQREDIADNALVAAAEKINTDWVRTNTPEQAAAAAAEPMAAEAGQSIDVVSDQPTTEEQAAPSPPPPLDERDEAILAELTKRLKRKLRAAGFRQDEMGVIVENFQAYYRQRGYAQFRPGVRTVNVTTNQPKPQAPPQANVGASQEPPKPEANVAPEPQVTHPAAPDPNLTAGQSEPVQSAAGIPISKDAASAIRRKFISGGNQDPLTRTLVFRRDSIIRKHNAKVLQATRDLQRAVSKSGQKISEEELNEALADPAKMAQLPTDVAVEVAKIRDHIDLLSDQIQMLGGVTPEMFMIIEGNKGSYITRSFKKFDDPVGWMKIALNDPQIMADFAAEVRQSSPQATDQEIKSLAEELLRRNTLSPGAAVASGSTTQNYVNILKKRKNLSPAILALYGENKNIYENYANTVGQMSSMVAHRGFIENLAVDGLAAGLFSREGGPRAQPNHVAQVSHKMIPQLAGMKGILMDPELAQAIDDLYALPNMNRWLTGFASASGLIKAAKTLGAVPRAYVRNLAGNIPMTIANGNWRFFRDWAGPLGGFKDFAGAAKTTLMDDLLNQASPQAKAEMERMKELGVVESFRIDELKDAARHSQAAVKGFLLGQGGILSKTVGTAARVYAAADTVSKIHNYRAELETLQRAFPNAPLASLEERAARITRALNPTYSEASAAAKAWSRYAPLGSFAMFSAEVIRTQGNRMAQTFEEISSGNPVLVAQGWRRFVGQGVALTMMGALGEFLQWLWGTQLTDEQMAAMRDRLPNYQKHSQIVPTELDSGGYPTGYIDLGYNDPFGIFTKTAHAAAYGGKKEAVMQALEPFVSEDILASIILSVWRGRDERDMPIADKGLSTFEQNKQIMQFAGKKANIAGIDTAGRIYKGWKGETTKSGVPLDFWNEVVSAAGGVRVETFARDVSDFYRNRDYDDRVKASQTSIRRMFLAKGSFNAAEVRRKYEDAEATRRQTMADWRSYVESGKLLGEQNPYGKVVRDVGQESIIIKQMYSGNYTPYRFQDEDFGEMRKLPQGQERVKLFQELYRKGMGLDK